MPGVPNSGQEYTTAGDAEVISRSAYRAQSAPELQVTVLVTTADNSLSTPSLEYAVTEKKYVPFASPRICAEVVLEGVTLREVASAVALVP